VRAAGARHGLARTLSKLGLCSRTQAAQWISDGRVRVDDRVQRDPEFPIVIGRTRISVDDREIDAPNHTYLMLNKPRGLVTTARDEQGRDTVYRCLDGAGLPWVAPVGRLDKASEGLLLFTNDPEWAAGVTDPMSGPDKTYHVQVDRIPDAALLSQLEAGVDCDGELLRAKEARLLRAGSRNAWLEIVLDEGRNRQIRRLLAAHDIEVVRLVRIAIGGLPLGTLQKGKWRFLESSEVAAFASKATLQSQR
jgi:23S rRNA pseudouridine2605 synthase